MSSEDSLLSELCTICHINQPKYRCPRCSIRTCSLPCSRRHKLWSQCSGLRDPAAYLRRSELASEGAFDRDFNFITGIERGLERAERDADNRGIHIYSGSSGIADPAAVGLEHEFDHDDNAASAPADRKRKRVGGDGGLVKGEAGFLRGAESAGVKIIRAPRGMSRNKANGSKWHPKHKCLNWMVEWIAPNGERRNRHSLESSSMAEAYDRVFPLPKQVREQNQKDTQDRIDTNAPEFSSGASPQGQDQAVSASSTAPGGHEATEAITNAEFKQPALQAASHRELYFYLHRPRTATKHPVLIPLAPGATFTAALRDHTVVEFPTIYILSDPPERLRAPNDDPSFILEEEYLLSQPQAEVDPDQDSIEADTSQLLPGSVDITNVDEKKVLEVLKQDLFEPISGAASP
ncbi:hypothetical protein FE257_001000 [Aspergillus nanangensis]|uniref:Box C/D snoRNA protein 1 n=1 Tax=Aspergillus nanangensis TaxID=2582783 RepID=A0AAD4CUC4_ASPNN|nr:hypothetical protein FE257_001000 [Aspergillus nanangensis]